MPKNQNITFIKLPLSVSYWKQAVLETKKLKVLIIISLLIAINIVISSFFILVGENLKIFFTFIPISLSSFIGGPILALISGFLCDILGFIVHPTGAFFPGYTLSAMLGALIYALFLYRAKITVFRLFLAKSCINLFVNVGLGSLWSVIMFGKAYYYYLAKSIIKNSLMLPIEVIILVIVFQIMLPIMSQSGLSSKQPAKRIPLI